MNISKPAALSPIDTSSGLTKPSSSDTIILKDGTPPIGSSTNGLSLWRSILDTHGREILECASNQFLDLAVVLRLETTGASDLGILLAKAGRLGHGPTDVIEGDVVDPLVHELNEGTQPVSMKSASTLLIRE
jgi:hypothetical protein